MIELHWSWLLATFLVGLWLGMGLMACCAAAGNVDRCADCQWLRSLLEAGQQPEGRMPANGAE